MTTEETYERRVVAWAAKNERQLSSAARAAIHAAIEDGCEGEDAIMDRAGEIMLSDLLGDPSAEFIEAGDLQDIKWDALEAAWYEF